MKRLFIVRDNRGRPVKDGKLPMHFSIKTHAKNVRDELNKTGEHAPYTVSRGPDHIGPHGCNYPKFRRQPKRGEQS